MFAFLSDSWLLITSTIAVIVLAYKYLTRNHRYWSSLNVPGPEPVLFFGNLLELFTKPLSDIEVQRFRDFGRIHGSYDFNQPILTVGEPELIKQIMVKDFNQFVNRRRLKIKNEFFNTFLIVIRDDNWKRLRAITSPTFSSGKLRKMFAMIDHCVEALVKKLHEVAESGHELDVKWLFGSYTMNVIAKCAFATDTNALEDKNNPFVHWAYKAINVPLWRAIFAQLMPGPVLDWLDWSIAPPESFGFFKDVAKHVLNERKARPESGHKHNDFLQLLVDAQRTDDEIPFEEMSETNEELIANRNALNIGSNVSRTLTEVEIISNIVLFLVAGYETTASLLSLCAYNLALNPESQRKLYEELKSCPQLDYESVHTLEYLDAVVCETLRLHNPVTRVEREANQDYELSGTGIVIKKDSVVAIPIHAIHHDPEFYPNPYQFRPERFYGQQKDTIRPYTFLPFGGGPRNCIGMRFALVEAKLALAKIIQKFQFTPSANTEVPLRYSTGRPGLLQAVAIKLNVELRA